MGIHTGKKWAGSLTGQGLAYKALLKDELKRNMEGQPHEKNTNLTELC